MKTNENIMTKKQLEVLMDLASKYEIKLLGIEEWSVEEAADKIKFLYTQLTRGKLKKRDKPYDIKYLLEAFERKYPETYNAIVNREEDGVEKSLYSNGHDMKAYDGKGGNHKRSNSKKNNIKKSNTQKSNMKKSNAKSCNTCMLMKRGECFGKKEICPDYKHSPSVSEKEKENWPTYGDATAFKLGKRRF